MNQTMQATDVEVTIRTRRTIKPEKMNGRVIPDEVITGLLSLADCAPTHARTEPWRFIVYNNDRVKDFASKNAELYRETTDPEKFTSQKFDNLVRLGENVSHIIIVWMKRVANHKIPLIEEIAATSAAIQNLLLAARSQGIASFWSTGGAAHHAAFKEEFKIGDEDLVLGVIYLGYSDEPFKEPNRLIPLSDKIEWVK